MIKLFEKVEETSNLVTLGTVNENIGEKGTMSLNLGNLAGDKLIIVDLTNGEGETQRVYCSVELSKFIRTNKLKKQEIFDLIGSLKLAVTTNNDGEQRFKIVRDSSGTVSGKATGAPKKILVLDEVPW